MAVGDTLGDEVIASIRLFDTVSHSTFIIKHVTIVKLQMLNADHTRSRKTIQRVTFTRFL